jgi:aspartyl-tRNA(Asn)/glutamyl-tRNA(Gln) amidotransferase subunit A
MPADDYLPGADVSLDGLRVGCPENFFFDAIDAEVESAVRRAVVLAGELGATVVPVRVPDIAAINVLGRLILLAEASAVMEPYLSDRTRFGTDVLALLDQGRLIPATDYVQAQRLRRLAQQEFASLWKTVDCLMMPATAMPAPRIGETKVPLGDGEEDVRVAATRLVRPMNVLGLPALSMPCGRSRSGLPIGVQIAGPPFQEKRILRLGAALEDAMPSIGCCRDGMD